MGFDIGIATIPLPNVYLGVSIEDQQTADERLTHLARTSAAKRIVSLEPMLREVGNLNLKAISLVIIGCESGPRRRTCDVQWIRSVVNQCKGAGVPCFVKQINIDGKAIHDIDQFPKHLRVREMP